MLLSAERLMLSHIARQSVATWCLQYLTYENQLVFNHIHKAGLLEPAPDYLSYHLSERGRAALAVGDGPHRALFDGMRDADEAW